MAHFEIIAPDGRRWNEDLREQEPLTIGRHTTNTIAIDDDQVPTLLARVLWNKKVRGYEITAATDQDLQLSGKPVRTALLESDDELNVAGYRLVYQAVDDVPPVEIPLDDDDDDENAGEADDDPDALVDLDGPKRKSRRKKRKRKRRKSKTDEKVELSKSVEAEDESLGEWLTKKRRPGERDPLRSPLVTSLAFLGLILLVSVAAVYLLIGRDAANAQIAAARADREAGKFGQAASRYEQFLDEFAYSKYANQARRELAFTQIDLALTGIASDLKVAIQEVEQFVDQFRQDDDFRDTYPDLARYASRIALDAYAEASRRHDPQFLTLGDEARSLFNRFYTGEPQDPRIVELEQAARSARADLLEFDVRRQALAEMDTQLEQQQVSATLATFRKAAARYPDFAADPAFVERVQQALEQERKLVVASNTPADASAASPPASEQPAENANIPPGDEAVLFQRQQARFDLQSDGQTIWLEANGEIFGIDRQTGKPVWKQHVGSNNPFPPFPVTTVEQAWLLAADGGNTLRLVERDSGRLLWETQLPATVATAPLVQGALAYLVAGDILFSLDLETGRLLGTIRFPRPLSAPVAALDERRLIAIGEADVFYELDRMRWTCEAVRYYGQAPGSIEVQPFLLDESLLLIESDRLTAGRLQVLDRNDTNWRVQVIQSERLPGIAVGQPVYWGDRLFLETYGPRIAVWQMSDRPNQPPLERLTVAPLPFADDTRVHILPVEGDRLLIAGESLRELTLLTNTFEQTDLGVQLGRSSQRLQQAGTQVFLAGRTSAESGVTLLDFDYESQKSSWSLQLASPPRRLLINTEAGETQSRVFNGRGQQFQLTAGTFSQDQETPAPRWINSNESLFEQAASQTNNLPIHFVPAASGTDFAVHRGSEVRLLNGWGETVRKLKLPGIPTRPACLLGTTLLWADEHSLHWTSLAPNSEATEPWDLPLVASEPETTSGWGDLQLTDDQSALAIQGNSRVIALRRREEPRFHLSEVASFPLPHPVRGPGVVHDGLYSLLLKEGTLISLDAATLLVRNQRKLDVPAHNGPWAIDGQLLIETADHALQAFPASGMGQPSWSLPFGSARIALPPQSIGSDQCLLCLTDGRVLLFGRKTGQPIDQWELPAAVACPAGETEDAFWFGLQNGSVVRIPR